MLTASILDGKSLAEDMLDESGRVIEEEGLTVSLHVVLVGDDEASKSYIRQKTKSARKIGMETRVHEFSSRAAPSEVTDRIESLNQDPAVSGIIVQLPLPDSFDEEALLEAVEPRKDVDGLHPVNFGKLLGGGAPFFYPPTPRGIMTLLDHYEVPVTGRTCVMVGMGRLVGRPLSQMLLNQGATLFCLNENTPNLSSYTRQGDVLVVGAGHPRLIKKDHVQEGAVVVDAGIHRIDGELVGDVEFDSVVERAGLITPVPGGVGPLTVAGLLANTCQAARRGEPGR